MRTVTLGRTGIEVTELCLGCLPMGPLQKNLDIDYASDIIANGLNLGVTFIDTAQMYKTYPPIRKALKETGKRPVISTKSAATTYEDMEKAVDEALSNLDIEYVDIFLLHAARASIHVFEERSAALQCLLDNKAKGKIKAVGISTHSVDVVNLAASKAEIDIIFPIINLKGMGILDGNRQDMEKAILHCYENDKGVFLMKALGGGNLINEYKDAMDYAVKIADGKAAIALGMVTTDELMMNLKYFNNEDVVFPKENLNIKRFMILPNVCKACGACIPNCHNNAISMKEKAVIHEDLCLKCGYCVGCCSEFAIRMA